MARGNGRSALALVGAALAMAAAMTAPPATAVEFGCQIGKPSYCFKYGQMFCLKENALPGREQACADWTSACLACHARIPECLGGTRPSHKSRLCRACDRDWRACMHAIDAAFWPNRRTPKPAE